MRRPLAYRLLRLGQVMSILGALITLGAVLTGRTSLLFGFPLLLSCVFAFVIMDGYLLRYMLHVPKLYHVVVWFAWWCRRHWLRILLSCIIGVVLSVVGVLPFTLVVDVVLAFIGAFVLSLWYIAVTRRRAIQLMGPQDRRPPQQYR